MQMNNIFTIFYKVIGIPNNQLSETYCQALHLKSGPFHNFLIRLRLLKFSEDLFHSAVHSSFNVPMIAGYLNKRLLDFAYNAVNHLGFVMGM